jgi:hypothetical protein
MNHSLKELCGSSVTSISEQDDYLQIVFSDHECVNVFNQYSLSGVRPALGFPLKVIDVEESQSGIVLKLSDDVTVNIDLTDDAFRGPEAIQWNRENGDVIVW